MTDYRLRQEIRKMGQEHPVVHGSAKKKKKGEGILKGVQEQLKELPIAKLEKPEQLNKIQ